MSEESDSEEKGTELVCIQRNEPKKFGMSVRQEFLSKVIANLHDWFPQVDILEAFTVFDPAGLLVMVMEHLNLLLDHYNLDGPMAIYRDRCTEEYTGFSTFIKSHAKLKLRQSLQELAQGILSQESLCDLFPSVSKLLVHALVLPVSTTDCECCFSTMKRVKTDLRNRMNTTTLDKLLHIRIEGPDLPHFNLKKGLQATCKES